MSGASSIVDCLLESDLDAKSELMRFGDELDAERAVGDLTPSVVRTLGSGDLLYSRFLINATGEPVRVRVTSVKTWKRRPDDFEIKFKHGMYTHGVITPQEAEYWTLNEPPGIEAKEARLRKKKLGSKWDDLRVPTPPR